MSSIYTDEIYSEATKLIDKSYAKAWMYTIEKALIFELKWIGFVESHDFRRTLDETLPLVYTYKPTHWLGNNREMRVIAPADQQWTSDVWFPRLVTNKFEKMAIVEAQDLFNKRGVNKIIEKASGVITFDTMYFSNVEGARRWLAEK